MSNSENSEAFIPKKRKIPVWLRAVLIKAWFAGAVYFFIGWGLFINTTDQLDITLALGLVLGIITDVVVNNIFRGMKRKNIDYYKYMMFPRKKIASFFLNIIYAIILSFLIAYTYNFINYAAIKINSLPENSIVLGAEPILFGIFCVAYDMLFLAVKRLIMNGLKNRDNKDDKTSIDIKE